MRLPYLQLIIVLAMAGSWNTPLSASASRHPHDNIALIKALKSENPEQVRSAARVLCKEQDLLAVPGVIGLLKSKNALVRREAICTLECLITPESIDALEDFATGSSDKEEVKDCQRFLVWAMANMKLSHMDWHIRSPGAKKELITRILKGLKFRPPGA